MEHNSSIGCNVTECKHHCKEDDFCTLNQIKVVKNHKTSTAVDSKENTDCGSFELR